MSNINGAKASEIHINSERVRKFIEEIEAQATDIEELREYDKHIRPKEGDIHRAGKNTKRTMG